jgi:meiotic recombination protein SPO11
MPSIPRRQERRPESWQNSVVSSGQNVPVSATINSSSSSLVTVPLTSHSSALAKIESLMESMLDAVIAGVELTIPYRTVRSAPAGPGIRSSQNHDRQSDIVRFPGRTIQEAKRFGNGLLCFVFLPCTLTPSCLPKEALFCILQLSHEALLSGKLITKRFGDLERVDCSFGR